MDEKQCSTEGAKHNHPVLEPENGELYHPDSDPRKLFSSCQRCAEIMQDWDIKIRQMMEEGA